MGVLLACMFVHRMCTWYQILWNWNYIVSHHVCVMGIEPGSSVRATSTLFFLCITVLAVLELAL